MQKRSYSTDREIQALKPADKHYDARDAKTRNLIVRVGPLNSRGEFRRTFCFVSRFPGSNNPTRHAFGEYGELSLEEARQKADAWRAMIREGTDPRDESRREREEAVRLREQAKDRERTFGVIAAAYLAAVAVGPDPNKPKQRKGNEVARDVNRTLVPIWGDRPITEITRRDIRSVVEDIRDVGTAKMLTTRGVKADVSRFARSHPGPAPVQAHNILGYTKRIFGWALDSEKYGLEANPAADLRPRTIFDERPESDRILSDDELAALWRVAEAMPYPAGPYTDCWRSRG